MLAFDQMQIHRNELHYVNASLRRFVGETVHPVGTISFPITTGAYPCQTTIMTNFLVVDCPSAYNAIIGRTTLNRMKAITFAGLLKMKFLIDNVAGEVNGD